MSLRAGQCVQVRGEGLVEDCNVSLRAGQCVQVRGRGWWEGLVMCPSGQDSVCRWVQLLFVAVAIVVIISASFTYGFWWGRV